MKIQLSDHFTYGKLLRFTFPSVVMMVFTSVYGVVDGLFVSNVAGKTAFAAVNFIMPFLMMLGTAGFMFGTGGSALVAKTLGERKPEQANRIFSLLTYAALAVGVALAGLGQGILRPVARVMGAEGQLLEDCVRYGRIIILANPAFVLQMAFQSFFITAEKPGLGLWMTVISGVANMVLDALFVMVFRWGIEGAAAATAVSQLIGGVAPLWYFGRKNTSLLRLGRTHFDGKALLQTCTNGSSELMSNISMNLVGMLYNIQLMAYAGENGVAAYGVLMYVNFVFLAIFIGYSIGSAPVISFHYGADNRKELRNLLKKSFMVIGLSSLAMLALGLALGRPLSRIFVSYDEVLFEMTVRGFRIFSFSFLFAGLAIFGSSFFTALNNGLVSAVISFLRTLVFQIGAVFLLPLVWQLDGIWLSVVVAEFAAAALSLAFMAGRKKKYGY